MRCRLGLKQTGLDPAQPLTIRLKPQKIAVLIRITVFKVWVPMAGAVLTPTS
jgi:hypothetical protein